MYDFQDISFQISYGFRNWFCFDVLKTFWFCAHIMKLLNSEVQTYYKCYSCQSTHAYILLRLHVNHKFT
ncbi:unnamed protein product [Urochloa humidicola]